MLDLPTITGCEITHLRCLVCAAGAVAIGLFGPVHNATAQESPAGKPVSYPVVQPLPSAESLQLNAALARLGRNPRDLDALADAGAAALGMGDVDAALGFFRRADQISSSNPRVKAGLASALVRKGDPFAAIPLFDAAEKAGAKAATLAADRGLAYDLVGDNATAQRLYGLALAAGQNGEVTRRLALSQAISGDRRAADATLLPLLRDQDKAAWRTRAFALAIVGQTDEAVRLAKTILPERLATEMAPYLRYMPRLTPAQMAAAANLGTFPRASEIGTDDPRVAQYAATGARRPALASADAGLVPQGAPLGAASGSGTGSTKRDGKRDSKQAERSKSSSSKRQASQERAAPPEPQPERKAGLAAEPELAVAAPVTRPAAPAPARAPVSAVPPAAQGATSAGSASAARAAAALAAATPATATSATATPSTPAAPATPATNAAPPPANRSGFDLAAMPNSAASGSMADRPGPAADTGARAERSLSEIFSDLGQPSTNPVPAAGAVDIRRIKPAEPKAEPPPKPAKPPPPSHPSRIWVQLGVGRDKAAMAFDWRRLVRKAPDALRNQKPYVSRMGQTNRLLAGPFESEKAAGAFLATLRKAGFDDPYVWTSPAGQVVDALPEK